MRRFVASSAATSAAATVVATSRRRALSTAAAAAAAAASSLPRPRASASSRLPPSLHIYGGSESERQAMEARLARVIQKSPMLQQESVGIVILDDTIAAPQEEASSGFGETAAVGARQANVASSAPLVKAFLEFPLITGSSLLTVYNVKRQELVAAHGEDVVEAWARDTLRRHLRRLGGFIEARRPLLLEPALLDLSETGAEDDDDEELAWALSKKLPLAAASTAPRSFLPPRYMQEQAGRMVCLVFPDRLVKSTEWLHRIQRQLVDFARLHMLPIQTHYLSLEKATSPDPAVREAEARRFALMASRLPPQSLVLGEEASLNVLVDWTARLKGMHDVSTYNLALANYLYKSPSDLFAGQRVLSSLNAHSRILVTYHIPGSIGTAKVKEAAEHRGQRIVSVLGHLFDERAKGNQALKPRIEAAPLKDCLEELAGYTLLVLHSGANAIDDDAVKEVLVAANEAGVPVITPGLLKAYFKGGARTVAAALKPWPPSFSFSADEASGASGGSGVQVTSSTAAAAAEELWEFGFRRSTNFDCGECESWACSECTKKQQAYAKSLGGQHRREIGQDWRDMF